MQLFSLAAKGAIYWPGCPSGDLIRAKKFATAVKKDGACASVCGFVWLSGVQQFLEPGARVGFRAASEASEPGSASLGAYLNAIGLQDRATKYVTGAPSDGINWLDHVQAEKLGIAVAAWPSVATPPDRPRVLQIVVVLLRFNASADDRRRATEVLCRNPEPELVAMGVQPGTLFFVGQQKGRAYRGTAIAFRDDAGHFHTRSGARLHRTARPSDDWKRSNLDGTCRLKSTWEATLMLIRVGQQSPSRIDDFPSTQPPYRQQQLTVRGINSDHRPNRGVAWVRLTEDGWPHLLAKLRHQKDHDKSPALRTLAARDLHTGDRTRCSIVVPEMTRVFLSNPPVRIAIK